MRYEFHPGALAEYEEAARYYAVCQKGLELRFIAAVEHAVKQIIEAPELWRINALPPRPQLLACSCPEQGLTVLNKPASAPLQWIGLLGFN